MEFDKDLAARQEARALCRRAEEAQKILAAFTQEQLDKDAHDALLFQKFMFEETM